MQNSIYVEALDRDVAISTIEIARTLNREQICELRALRGGRWCGDPLEVTGLRSLGLQNDALGVTTLGAEVADLVSCDWRTRQKLGL